MAKKILSVAIPCAAILAALIPARHYLDALPVDQRAGMGILAGYLICLATSRLGDAMNHWAFKDEAPAVEG